MPDMKKETNTRYNREKYDEQEDAVWDMTKQELAEEIKNIAQTCLSEYHYAVTDVDFESHRRQMTCIRQQQY